MSPPLTVRTFSLDKSVNHLGAEVVDGLHLCGLEGELADLGASAGRRSVHLDLHHLALDDLSLLPAAGSRGGRHQSAKERSRVRIPAVMKVSGKSAQLPRPGKPRRQANGCQR